MTNESYKMRLKKGEDEIEVIGDKKFVIEKFEELRKANITLKIPSSEKIKEVEKKLVEEVKPPIGLVGFMKKMKASGDVNITLTLAYYFFNEDNMESFNIDDLRAGYKQIKRPLPKNLSDKIYQNIKKGYLMENGSKKDGKVAYTITQLGMDYVDNDFKKSK